MLTYADLAAEDRSARKLLTMLASPSDPTTGNLVSRHGAIDTVALLDSDDLIAGVAHVESAVWRERLRAAASPERAAARLSETDGFRFITPGDDEWPTRLNDLGTRAPFGLWARGRVELLKDQSAPSVTVSGARAATHYGESVTNELCSGLSKQGAMIIASAAYGIDGAAHRAALTYGADTIAVLASGVDRPYPMGHASLFERLADQGVLVSEVPPCVSPTRQRFLNRSRLLAALSDAMAIVEAGARSGTLHTVTEAEALGRAIGAVPGPITSAASFGTNLLLQEQRAQLVTSGSDVVRLIEPKTDAPERTSIHQGAPVVSRQNSRVL